MIKTLLKQLEDNMNNPKVVAKVEKAMENIIKNFGKEPVRIMVKLGGSPLLMQVVSQHQEDIPLEGALSLLRTMSKVKEGC